MKPNENQSSDKFDESVISSQLSSSGTFAYQMLMRNGFPDHINITDLHCKFEQHFHLFEYDSTDQKQFWSLLIRSSGLIRKDFKFGNSKIFFRAGKLELLNEKLSNDLSIIIERFKKIGVLRLKWRTAVIAIIKQLKMHKKKQIEHDNESELMAPPPKKLKSDAESCEDTMTNSQITGNKLIKIFQLLL